MDLLRNIGSFVSVQMGGLSRWKDRARWKNMCCAGNECEPGCDSLVCSREIREVWLKSPSGQIGLECSSKLVFLRASCHTILIQRS